MTTTTIIIATALVSAIVFIPIGIIIRKKVAEAKIESAEKEAKRLLDNVKVEVENLKKEELIKAKEEVLQIRNELDQEIKERRGDVQAQEKRLIQKEENLEKRASNFDSREKELERRIQENEESKKEIEDLIREERETLQRISGLSEEQAKEQLLQELDKTLTHEKAQLIKDSEEKAKEESSKTAKEIIAFAIQKCAADHTSETTVSVVSLPNDEMKGRIIGREGRNIRTIEAITGVDLIIDDTPEVIVLSSFDPLRREIAKTTLEALIKDGRIHPARIEELYDKVCEDFKNVIKEKGEEALFELNLTKVDPYLVELIGKLNFRTSYGQNALSHSKEVAHLAGLLASELGENVALAKRAGLLHDIGKAIDFEVEGSHVEIGADVAKKANEDPVVINAIESHHGDKKPTSVISELVQIADALSASRPGARNDSLENYVKRLEQLEAIGNEVEGVDKTFAMQAGRELRVIVKPEEIDDAKSYKIARDIKDRVEAEMQYPGTIKVVVIRETRAEEIAK